MASTQRCHRCGEEFEVPGSARVQMAFRPTGMMHAAGPEQPLHKCATLSPEDELELVRDISACYEVDIGEEPTAQGEDEP